MRARARARCGASSATTMAAAWREKEEGPAVDPFDVEKMGAQGQHVINWYVGCWVLLLLFHGAVS